VTHPSFGVVYRKSLLLQKPTLFVVKSGVRIYMCIPSGWLFVDMVKDAYCIMHKMLWGRKYKFNFEG
jgi:hypothetical protein